MENKMKSNAAYLARNLITLMGLIGLVQGVSYAGITNLSNSPLASGIGATSLRPNIAFVVDDSLSMVWDIMPDDGTTNSTKLCRGFYKYNVLAYNPAITYKPPFKLDGAAYTVGLNHDGLTRYPDASFTAVLKDGFFANGVSAYDKLTNTQVDLSTAPYSTGTVNYYYTTSSTTSTTCLADANYTAITSASSIAAPNATTGSTAAKTNYANWYSYYRTRANTMKSGTGEAFSTLPENTYRLGLFFINSIESGAQGAGTNQPINHDLKIADFDGSASGTQRYNWFSDLYSGKVAYATPLRGALSRMGRMYAGQISGWDPVQYSCQQNFTILSTDGTWNNQSETTSYGPLKIDGTHTVGNQDAGAVSAVGATATIKTNNASFANGDCYRATSVTVSGTQLLPASPTFGTCASGNGTSAQASRADLFGSDMAANINANTATTGFTALYNSTANTVTITAPTSLGLLTATPVLTTQKVSGSGTETFTITAFGGGVVGQAGVIAPYKDIYGAQNTLADVAYYYYTTDLRDQATLNNCQNTINSTNYTNLCENNVLGGGKDNSSTQHMTTFTIGLGTSGTITYQDYYETAGATPGVTTYYNIVNGTANWPDPTASGLTTICCDGSKIDDLWHAAVNGRGTYFSVTDAQSIKSGVQGALAGVQSRTGSSAAAATSNLEPVAGDNYVYVALYRTQNWDGDLQAYTIDPDTGALAGSALWSAQSGLDGQVTAAGAGADGRTIKYFSSSGTNKLKDFTSTNLTADSLNSNFANICSNSPAIAQCSSLTTAQVTVANTADNLINYLRGRDTFDMSISNATVNNQVFRVREHVLGDTVNAVPVYMKKPPFSYDQYDATYGTFKTNNATRAATVFVAANDGMLHAFGATNDSTDADYGNRSKERWAFIPRAVMPNMWKLADQNYGNNHRYFVDGSPTVADICTTLSTSDSTLCRQDTYWKTIVVGGLNSGGCSYYALDVTDPTAPKGLWEFTNANLGYTFGNPVIGKDKTGRWVVIISSGYNNYPSNGCGNTGDGNGHVFVLDAYTGSLLSDIVTYTSGTTPAGTTGTPSGLARLNAWIEDATLPVIDRLYGGDTLGNLWRFDYDNNYAPSGKDAMLLAHLVDGSGNAQPITIKPELAEVTANGSNYAVVMVGTGRYLGSNDLNDQSQQSIYAIKDSMGTTGLSDVRGSNMVVRTLTQTTGSTGSLLNRTIRTVSGANIDWASKDGWYMDLNPGNTSPGERVNVDMSLQYNILTVAANVPTTNACDVGGYAFLYFLDINTGKNLTTSLDNMAGVRLGGNALVAGIKTLKLSSGKTVTVVTDTAGGVGSESNPSSTGAGTGSARRTAWHELQD
jgi:type IV pilus assembly protein PilY1